MVKQGNIIVLADNDKIHPGINKENNPTCLLTKSDAEEVIAILTSISGNIGTTLIIQRRRTTENCIYLTTMGKRISNKL